MEYQTKREDGKITCWQVPCQQRSCNDKVGQWQSQNDQVAHVALNIYNIIQQPICSTNRVRTNYPPNRNPTPTRFVRMRIQRKVEIFPQLTTLQRSAENFIQDIVPDTYIYELSQPFIKFRGVTPYILIKHKKKDTAFLTTCRRWRQKKNITDPMIQTIR